MSGAIVETAYGKVQGDDSGTVLTWRGIPYARAPIGPLRFRPPQPPERWIGVRDATNFGPACPQPPSPLGGLFGERKVELSEDCLSLNVWSPAADGAARPVMVWIHGGAFTGGTGQTPWYDGTAFAAHGDLVVVTINYRLGFLGFLHLADLGGEAYAGSGNCGMLDQVAALEWVRDNIAVFGGDPARVTIFGESAGGMSVGTLLGMPAAQGLFRAAIPQSGAAHNARTRDEATTTARQLLTELGVPVENLAALHEVPVDDLLAAQTKLSLAAGGGLIAQPVVDGVTLPQLPYEAVAGGSAAGVAMLVGTNRDEVRLFTALAPQTNDDEGAERFVRNVLSHEDFTHMVAAYESANPGGSRTDAVLDVATDRVFRIPAIRLAEAAVAQRSPTWMYRFDWKTPVFGGKLGAAHALEIPFVFDNLDKPGISQFTGDSPVRQEIASRMHAAWIAFARTGDPNSAGLPAWPAYDTRDRATMIFDEASRVEDDPQGAERQAWEGEL